MEVIKATILSNVNVYVKNLYTKVDSETIGQSTVGQKHDLAAVGLIALIPLRATCVRLPPCLFRLISYI